ncbi:hypothetical protein PGTUg99_021916 [Puccinia graminis f. sp. tritici]|uniref:Uncharacterized protein n=1 Tax=Puccinia graminis f. sp. tritici TaxID=56615 RepID=A0A5B0RWF9_PUCGR|nr:hypothetical protein PGTUg99_021916 [Puccinia graminis f. sp. tritici]
MFCIILVHSPPSNPDRLLLKFLDDFGDDSKYILTGYRRQTLLSAEYIRSFTLFQIQQQLNKCQKTFSDVATVASSGIAVVNPLGCQVHPTSFHHTQPHSTPHLNISNAGTHCFHTNSTTVPNIQAELIHQHPFKQNQRSEN